MVILNSKKIVERLKMEIVTDLSKLRFKPFLHIIQVGNNECCSRYVSVKQKLGEKFGAEVVLHYFQQASDEEIINLIEELNASPKCNGIIVQLPLPKENNCMDILAAIDTYKDVDCFKYVNSRAFNEEDILPPVVSAVKVTIEEYKLDLQAKTVLLIGKGLTAGMPLMCWLANKPVTLIVCDKNEKNISRFFPMADFVISAVGKHNLIDAKKLARKSYFFDVGTNVYNNVICGDLDYRNLEQAQFQGYTPTPGGIGALTAMYLFKNLIYFCCKQSGNN